LKLLIIHVSSQSFLVDIIAALQYWFNAAKNGLIPKHKNLLVSLRVYI